MSGTFLLLFALFFLICGYIFYGGFLAKIFGINPNNKTPAHQLRDNVDYVPTKKALLFGHHFASVAGASPINGPILAAFFGWLPVMLWVLLGSVFIGALHDFAALYASVKNKGKSIGYIIELYMGKTGKNIFLVFVWLLSALVIAAFSDIVADTFNGFSSDGILLPSNGAAALTSALFIGLAVVFGYCVNKFKANFMWASIAGIALLAVCMAAGIMWPVYLYKNTWLCLIFVYIFIASVAPVWLILQPRDYLNSFLLYALMLMAVLGVLFAQPTVNLPAFSGFAAEGKYLFPFLFITVACGAVSGFHSMIASGTTSKQIYNEKDIRPIAMGSMLLEALLAVLALICVGAVAVKGVIPQEAPPVIFANAIAGFLSKIGLPETFSFTFVTLSVSAFALTSLDTIARVGRMSFQEFFSANKFLANKYTASVITLGAGALLVKAGYREIWTLFGASNQLLAALGFVVFVVFFKKTGKKYKLFIFPAVFMLAVTLTALIMGITALAHDLANGASLLRFIFSLLLIGLAVMVTTFGVKSLISKS